MIWQPDEARSLYASYSRSFSTNFFGRSDDGSPFPPEQGVGLETGIKQTLLDGKLTATAALFQYVRQNVLTTDPADQDRSIPIGKQRSRGLELEVAGRPLSNLQLTANYTYLDARVTEGDANAPAGNRLGGVPFNTVGGFAKLGFAPWNLPEWSVGAGLAYAGSRPAALPNNGIDIPSYLKLDAALYWSRGPWRAQVNGENLSNERIYDGNNFSFKPRAPRSVAVTLGYRY